MKKQPTGDDLPFGPSERKLVLGVAVKVLRDPDAAEDAAQDAMLLAFRHRASFRGEARFTTWLYRIAATTAIMHLRKRRRRDARAEVVDVAVGESILAPGMNPEERVIVEDTVARAGRRLAKMGRIVGKIVSMCVAEGYSSVEAGRELGLSTAAVKSRVYRGRAALRAALG
ncbi:MAG TPA: RNA polymerase sigma factor [Haliangiales bacterium]|nr:RNA polymerase sigma factor [Haliangiales bacterium]